MTKKRKTAFLKFNRKIYKKEALEKAVSAYSDLAEMKIKEKNGYFIVFMDGVRHRLINVISDEFANFVLAQTKKCL